MRRNKRPEKQDHWGVWLAEWTGPRGEMILVATTSSRVRVDEEMIPLGASHVAASLRLLEKLEAVEPSRPMLQVI